MLVGSLALLVAALFTGAALYVNLVEHRATGNSGDDKPANRSQSPQHAAKHQPAHRARATDLEDSGNFTGS
jgi:hypothetical protein